MTARKEKCFQDESDYTILVNLFPSTSLPFSIRNPLEYFLIYPGVTKVGSKYKMAPTIVQLKLHLYFTCSVATPLHIICSQGTTQSRTQCQMWVYASVFGASQFVHVKENIDMLFVDICVLKLLFSVNCGLLQDMWSSSSRVEFPFFSVFHFQPGLVNKSGLSCLISKLQLTIVHGKKPRL